MKSLKRREFIMLAIAAAPLVAVPFWLRRSLKKSPDDPQSGNHDHHHYDTEMSAASDDSERIPAATPRIRHEASSPEAKKHLASYEKAIVAMKNEEKKGAAATGVAWRKQAEIHQNSCPHGTWAFFPWHREYLARFEDVIREMSGDPEFTLPYWDWSKNPELPKAFLKGSLAMPDESRKVKMRLEIAQYTSPKIVDRILETQDFETFMGARNSSGAAEVGPHNGVHIVMGGHGSPMGEFMSPLDPVFWLHHCNVDRLWAVWQEKNPEWTKPSQIEDESPGWLNVAVTGFYDKSGNKISVKRTAKDVLDTRRLGYVYSGTKAAANLSPAALARDPSGGGGFRTKVRAFTRDGIASEVAPGPALIPQGETAPRGGTSGNASSVDITFKEFRQNGNVDKFTDGFLAHLAGKNPDATQYENFIYRLRVKKFPKLPKNSSVRIGFLPEGTRGDESVFLTHYCFFGKAIEHGGETVPEFTLDYGQLLRAFHAQKPDALTLPRETSFRVEVVQAGAKLDLTDYQKRFQEVDFSLTVLERVYE